jgi:transcriptional regulator with XRE-family HTH domain
MSTENVDTITSDQCRGARGLLGITQPALASAAKLGLSTIVDFEKSRRPVSEQAVRAIRKALEHAGIEFIDENGGGPGVRLSKTQRAKRSK